MGEAIRDQLKIPPPYSRLREDPLYKEEFLLGPRDQQGDQWYWGRETEKPVLAAELDRDYPVLRDLTKHWPVWKDLDSLLEGLSSYVSLREELIDEIEQVAIAGTELEIQDKGRVSGGSLTRAFSASVFVYSVRWSARGSREPNPKFEADRNYLAHFDGTRWGHPGPPNYAIRVDGQVVAWRPWKQSLDRPSGMLLYHFANVTEEHRRLVAEWGKDARVGAVELSYRELDNLADRLQLDFTRPNLRRLLASSV